MALLTWLIVCLIFVFDLKNRRFVPAMAKFYWMLAMTIIPFAWILYLAWGRRAHALQGTLFDYSQGLPLAER
jgi:hypothetical protein